MSGAAAQHQALFTTTSSEEGSVKKVFPFISHDAASDEFCVAFCSAEGGAPCVHADVDDVDGEPIHVSLAADDELPFAVRVTHTARTLHAIAVPLARTPSGGSARRLHVRYTPNKAILIKFDSDVEADLSVELRVPAAPAIDLAVDVDENNAVVAFCLRDPLAYVRLPAAFVAHFARAPWLRLRAIAAAAAAAADGDLSQSAGTPVGARRAQRGHDVTLESAFDDAPDQPSDESAAAAATAAPSVPAAIAIRPPPPREKSKAVALPIHLAEVFNREPLSDAAMLLLPENLRFRHAVVRHIAWLCEPCKLTQVCERTVDVPTLVRNDCMTPFADEAWLNALRLRCQPQLLELDANPAPLIEWLSMPSRLFALRAVGTYFTYLLAFFLRDVCNFAFVIAKVQVFAQKQTVGDIDMLFRPDEEGAAMAWELSIKNYVEVRDPLFFDLRAEPTDPLAALNCYCGPLSTGDSLWNIVSRTHNRAKSLRVRSEYHRTLSSLHVDANATHTAFMLRGNLYEFWDRNAPPAPPAPFGSVTCRSVRWLSGEDGPAMLTRLGGGDELAATTRFVVLNKFDLCAAVVNVSDVRATAHLLTAQEFCERYRALLEDPVRALALTQLRLAADNQAWCEVGRWFLLPRHWSNQKR
jgi:hypothetical protein